MRDVGLIKNDEPFTNLLTQGMVLKDGSKMSKSKGNTVDPQALIDAYGADTARLFMMFAAPPDQSLEWADSGVEGSHRFLKRVWAFSEKYGQLLSRAKDVTQINDPEIKHIYREIHLVLKQVNFDYGRNQINTIVSGAMKLLNAMDTNFLEHVPSYLTERDLSLLPVEGLRVLSELEVELLPVVREGFRILLLTLSPICPHITHELWKELGYGDDILHAGWPLADESAMVQDTVEYVVQVNGKLRGNLTVSREASKETIEKMALEQVYVTKFLTDGASVRKIIVVPNKLVNLVIN
jgi:leucyl-tRNA synthetase